jgi:hypothetical protein
MKTTIRDERFHEFTALLDLIAAHGAQCELVLSPLNPAHAIDEEVLQMRRQVETRLRRLAAERGLIVRGSYDSRTVGLSAKDFVDYGHPRRDAYGKIFEYVAAAPVNR